MNKTTEIRDFYNKLLGTIEEDALGNKRAFDLYRRYLGKYDKLSNITYDATGKALSRGDITQTLVWNKK